MNQFIDAYKLVVLKNYANFEGRLGRGAFWRFVLVNLVISIVLSILAQTFGVVFWLAYVLYAVGVVIPGIAAGARRLHDTNKSAWLLLVGLIPFVGFIVLIVLFAMEGDQQANDHGPVPTDVYDEYA